MARLLGMKPYSEDLRQRVVRACEQERLAHWVVAKRFAVSLSFVEKLLHRWRQTGSLAAAPRAGGRASPLAAVAEPVRHWVAVQPDLPLEALRARLAADLGVPTSRSARSRSLGRVGLPRKNSRSTPLSATPPSSTRSTSRGARPTHP